MPVGAQSFDEALVMVDDSHATGFVGKTGRGSIEHCGVMGRVDDVINVAGHRLGTMEIESALVSHEAVAEAAVVGRPDSLKGEAIVAFVTLETGRIGDEALMAELKQHVGAEIGPIARPDQIQFTDSLPKTRSGKIMRRILRSLAAGEEISGDTSTLEDRSVLEALRV
jgi:acetyl-CoA synthetase